MNEYGTYQFVGGEMKTYNGGILNLGTLKSEYAIGEFELKFWDQAGNLKIEKNEKIWHFETPMMPTTLNPSDAGYLSPKNFSETSVGSAGKYDALSDFDMVTLYDGINTLQNPERAVSNHVVLSNTSDVTVTLSMGDVLALGVTNSFSIADVENARHKGQIQMRIDGQTGDKLNLDGLVNGLSLDWVGGQTSTNIPLDIGTEKYNVYTNATLGLALFVDQQIEVKVF
jgi:hypothetical protein